MFTPTDMSPDMTANLIMSDDVRGSLAIASVPPITEPMLLPNLSESSQFKSSFMIPRTPLVPNILMSLTHPVPDC